jgi:Tfp pilus assembly protein PilN
MIDIDFLPVQYHHNYAYRQSKPWQIIVVASFLGLVAIVTVSQKIHRRFVERELNGLLPAYETAVAQERRLTDVQNQLQHLDKEAELITYLHHPWPRSQLLSAVLSRLPEEITLEQLQIIHEADNLSAPSDRKSPAPPGNSDDQQNTITPAQRDLQTLQNQLDGKHVVIVLIGAATDSAAIHHFLNDMLSNSLFSKAELGPVTSANAPSTATVQFQARLVVKPGYGQLGGPANGQDASRAENQTETSPTAPPTLKNFVSQTAIKNTQ